MHCSIPSILRGCWCRLRNGSSSPSGNARVKPKHPWASLPTGACYSKGTGCLVRHSTIEVTFRKAVP
jgi:hypothetical protein